jgi:hypothetical protein
MKLSRATIALYVGLVFLCGGVLGFFANRLYTAATVNANAKNVTAKSPQDQEARKSLVGMFQTRLKLSDDQVQKLNLILDESQAQVTAIHRQMDPQLDAVRQNQITRMKLMLTSSSLNTRRCCKSFGSGSNGKSRNAAMAAVPAVGRGSSAASSISDESSKRKRPG